MKYIFYVVDLKDVIVTGTNDVDELEESGLLDSEDYIIIHNEGVYFAGSRIPEDIKPLVEEINEDNDNEEGEN